MNRISYYFLKRSGHTGSSSIDSSSMTIISKYDSEVVDPFTIVSPEEVTTKSVAVFAVDEVEIFSTSALGFIVVDTLVFGSIVGSF